MDYSLKGILFFCMCSAIVYGSDSGKRWQDTKIEDTLQVFLNDQPAGQIVSTFSAQKDLIETATELMIETTDLSGRRQIASTMVEKRVYGSDGALSEACQELSSPAGKNFWKLSKTSQGEWILVVTTGGVDNKRTISRVQENIGSTYAIYRGIFERTLKAGQKWTDTIFELTSGQDVISETVCRETPTKQNGSKWVFVSRNSISEREEIWECSGEGKTTFREIFPFVAKRKLGELPISEKSGVKLFEAFSIAVPGTLKESERICVRLDSTTSMDSSVASFYSREGNRYILKKMNQKCLDLSLETVLADTLVAYTKPTPIMQSSHQKVMELAASLRKDHKTRCELISAYNSYVFKKLKKQNTATFSSALETINAGFGDCGEHAVLLAALLRSSGVPARVVSGLVYIGPRGGYYYHAWVMAFTGEWIFADPSHGIFPANRDRIPLIIDDSGEKMIQLSKLIGTVSVEHISR